MTEQPFLSVSNLTKHFGGSGFSRDSQSPTSWAMTWSPFMSTVPAAAAAASHQAWPSQRRRRGSTAAARQAAAAERGTASQRSQACG